MGRVVKGRQTAPGMGNGQLGGEGCSRDFSVDGNGVRGSWSLPCLLPAPGCGQDLPWPLAGSLFLLPGGSEVGAGRLGLSQPVLLAFSALGVPAWGRRELFHCVPLAGKGVQVPQSWASGPLSHPVCGPTCSPSSNSWVSLFLSGWAPSSQGPPLVSWHALNPGPHLGLGWRKGHVVHRQARREGETPPQQAPHSLLPPLLPLPAQNLPEFFTCAQKSCVFPI